MKKKKMFEYFRNCSKRNLGKNVIKLYLLVLIELEQNLVSCIWRLHLSRLYSILLNAFELSCDNS